MHIHRGGLMAAIALTIMAAVPPSTAVANPPSPPYTAFVLDGGAGSHLLTGVLSFDAANATIGAAATAHSIGARVDSNDGHWWSLSFSLAPGSAIAIGTTYPTTRSGLPGTNSGTADIGGDGRGCNYQVGFMTVHELTFHTGTQELASLALSFTTSCETDVQVLAVEVRYNSSIGLSLATPNTNHFDFGALGVGDTSAARTVTFTATGTDPVVLGTATLIGATPGSFGTAADTCSGRTLAIGQSCSIGITARPAALGEQRAALVLPKNNRPTPAAVGLFASGQKPNRGTFYPLTPSRILDTREGIGAPKAPAGPGATLSLQVTGRGGVPASGVSAVVLNVTVVAPTEWGYVTVYPSGQTRPTASALNFAPGWIGANSVTVALGSNGRANLFNSGGNTHLIADVVGFYALDNSLLVTGHGYGGEFHPVTPLRLFDSREDWGERLSSDSWAELALGYDSTYSPHIRALAVNITAVDAAWPGYLTGFSGAGAIPFASTLNITPGTVVPNFAVVPTSTCWDCGPMPVPRIGVYSSTDVHVIVDLVGFYDDGQLADGTHDGLRFAARSPLRIVDSRIGQGMPGRLGSGATASVEPPAAALPTATDAVALNVTAVAPTADTFIAVWPTGLSRPTVSTLNPSRGQIVPNAAVALLGQNNRFNIYNNAGTIDMVVDMVGTFYYLPGVTGAQSSSAFKRADAEQADAGWGTRADPPRLTRLSPRLQRM